MNRGRLRFGHNKKLLILKGKITMKNFKRIISFVMAMIILTSFFCYNVGASNNPSYERYEFSGTYTLASFSDTWAYALVRIHDWAEETNTTDLKAYTLAQEEDYVDIIGFIKVVTYAGLTVYLEDGSDYYTSGGPADVDYESGEAQAIAYGSDCLNYDDHYSIVDFESSHEVVISLYVFDAYGDIVGYDEVNDGPIIEIATFD